MTELDANDVETAPLSAVDQAIRGFAEALTETPEYKAFEQAALALNDDAAAEQARTAFETKQKSLQGLIQLNALSPADRAELERLRQAFLTLPTVITYARAEAKLIEVCQMAGDLLSYELEIDVAAVCSSGGCC